MDKALNENFNELLNKRIDDYIHIPIGDKLIRAPYFINWFHTALSNLAWKAKLPDEHLTKLLELYEQREIEYGWYLGKGTPEEIRDAALTQLHRSEYDPHVMQAEAIVEFMKLIGLGVDCSGFVFNVFYYAFEKLGIADKYISSLDWPDRKKTGPTYAGVKVFLGEASSPIDFHELQAGDILEINGWHMAIIVEREKQLYIAQSNFNCIPTGINLSKLDIKGAKPDFEFFSTLGYAWNELWAKGSIKFRRLRITS